MLEANVVRFFHLRFFVNFYRLCNFFLPFNILPRLTKNFNEVEKRDMEKLFRILIKIKGKSVPGISYP